MKRMHYVWLPYWFNAQLHRDNNMNTMMSKEPRALIELEESAEVGKSPKTNFLQLLLYKEDGFSLVMTDKSFECSCFSQKILTLMQSSDGLSESLHCTAWRQGLTHLWLLSMRYSYRTLRTPTQIPLLQYWLHVRLFKWVWKILLLFCSILLTDYAFLLTSPCPALQNSI